MIFRLFLLELRSIRSDGRLLALVAVALTILLLSVWIGAESQRVVTEGRMAAIETSRQQWESIDKLSAHGVGHYGSYVYKPNSPLSTLDSGVMPFTGKVGPPQPALALNPLSASRGERSHTAVARCGLLLQATRYKLQATRYKLQATRYKLQATSYTLRVTRYTLQVTRYRLQVTSYE